MAASLEQDALQEIVYPVERYPPAIHGCPPAGIERLADDQHSFLRRRYIENQPSGCNPYDLSRTAQLT
jgi:hypothetical protein